MAAQHDSVYARYRANMSSSYKVHLTLGVRPPGVRNQELLLLEDRGCFTEGHNQPLFLGPSPHLLQHHRR
jgi:hypothetical protein